jgi:endonuclease/exonuclease/phosphatase family metal-dependent hydrolase
VHRVRSSQSAFRLLRANAQANYLPFLVAAAISTTLMLESTRVFLSYMVFTVGQGEREALAAIALAVFLAFGLCGVIVRFAGPHSALLIAGFALAAARLILQFWEDPYARLVLGAIAVICWGWLLPPMLAIGREAAAAGVGIGLVLDLAIRTWFQTVDLPWMPGLGADLVTILLLAIFLASIAQCAEFAVLVPCREPVFLDSVSLLGVGSGIGLYHLMTGNLGLASARMDTTIGPGAGLLGLGLVLGLACVALLFARPWSILQHPGAMPQWTTLSAILGGLGLWLLWSGGRAAQIGAELGGAGSTMLLMTCLLTVCRGRRQPGVGSMNFWFTAGMLVQAILLFAYFSFTGSGEIVTLLFLVLSFSALFGAWRQRVALTYQLAWLVRPLILVFLFLVVACAWESLRWNAPDIEDPVSGDLTAMTYNIQSGFGLNTTWDLERTAKAIEAENPDIVILQEVSRGWPITSGVDEATWLSQRLDMPVYFGPASVDGMWGNAILTKAPVSAVTARKFESSENLSRSVIEVRIDTTSGPLVVFGTHLDNPTDAAEIRLEETEQLIGFMDGDHPAVLGGDLNSDPDSEVVHALESAGLQNAGPPTGATFPGNGRRIDYIMVTGDVEVRDSRIPETTASDHKPVVADLTVAPP